MEQTAKRDKRTAAEWAAVFKVQAGSGISAARFCREQGIDYKRFLYHRNKNRKESMGHMAMTVSSAAVSVARQRGFIPVKVERCCSARFLFPRGLVLESDGLFPAAWVAEVAQCWIGKGGGLC